MVIPDYTCPAASIVEMLTPRKNDYVIMKAILSGFPALSSRSADENESIRDGVSISWRFRCTSDSENPFSVSRDSFANVPEIR